MTEASSPLARSIAPQTCIRSIQWIGTTTQLYASAAELRGGGSILARGAKAIVQHRLTATSVHYLRTVVMRTDRRNCQSRRLSCRRPQLDAWWDLADGCQAPQRDQQLAGQRQDHGLAGGHTAIGGARLEPLDQGALLLEA